jgi:hypothetical protein
MAALTPTQMDECRMLFEEFADERPDHWEPFKKESWRIVSDGAPREGEYADTLLQQLWESFLAGYEFAAFAADGEVKS